jgi:hypothetical protein
MNNPINQSNATFTNITYYTVLGLIGGILSGSTSSLIGTWIIPALGGYLDNPWQARAAGMLGGTVFGGCIGLLYGMKKTFYDESIINYRFTPLSQA